MPVSYRTKSKAPTTLLDAVESSLLAATRHHGWGRGILHTVSAQLAGSRIFYAARREVDANSIVAALLRQFTAQETTR